MNFNINASAKLKGGDEFTVSQGILKNLGSATPVWQVGNLSSGQTAKITINLFAMAGGEIPVSGKVSAFCCNHLF